MTTIKLTIEFETAVHHGSGYGLSGVVDRAALRDEAGMPYLAGSAIKGKFRHAAIRLLRAEGNRVCGTPERAGVCGKDSLCAVCQTFGSSRLPGSVIFRDAYPCDPEKSVLKYEISAGRSSVLRGGSDVRTSTAIDRATRTILPEHLFSTETIPALVRFEAELDAPEGSVGLLKDCAKLMGHFGGDSARGLGRCSFKFSAEGETP